MINLDSLNEVESNIFVILEDIWSPRFERRLCLWCKSVKHYSQLIKFKVYPHAIIFHVIILYQTGNHFKGHNMYEIYLQIEGNMSSTVQKRHAIKTNDTPKLNHPSKLPKSEPKRNIGARYI